MTLENRYSCSPEESKQFTTEQLRAHFLVPDLMSPGHIKGVYSHFDRMVTLGAMPTHHSILLPNYSEFTKQNHFLDRREIGVINIGGTGKISVDGESYKMDHKDCLYIGKGGKGGAFQKR